MPHYCLTEAQELDLQHAHNVIELVSDLAMATPTGTRVNLDPEGLSSLLRSVKTLIPDKDALTFQRHA